MAKSKSSSDRDKDLSFRGVAYNACDSRDLNGSGGENCSDDPCCYYDECCC